MAEFEVGKMELCMNEKWRLAKKGSRNAGSRRVGVGEEGLLRRSVEARGGSIPARPSFSGRCARLVKEQRARFYIMRRCVTMLICWHDCA